MCTMSVSWETMGDTKRIFYITYENAIASGRARVTNLPYVKFLTSRVMLKLVLKHSLCFREN